MVYYLTKFDDVIESGFSVTPKIEYAYLCEPIHDLINHFTFIRPFESGIWERKRKITKIRIFPE